MHTIKQKIRNDVVELSIYDDQGEALEALIDLVCGVLIPNSNYAERVKQQATDILLADHRRRLEQAGKHPITGETQDQYDKTRAANAGTHPITGLQDSDGFIRTPSQQELL